MHRIHSRFSEDVWITACLEQRLHNCDAAGLSRIMDRRHPFVVLRFDRCDDSLLFHSVFENIANDMLAGVLARNMQRSVATLVHS